MAIPIKRRRSGRSTERPSSTSSAASPEPQVLLEVRVTFGLQRPHAVVAGVVLQLRQAQRLEERGEVHAEAAAHAFLEAVPAADRILLRSAPGLDRALGG